MKNLTTLFFALFLLINARSSLFAQGVANDERIWSVVRPDPNGTTKIDIPSDWVPAEPITRYFGIADATVGPNFRVKPGNTTQSELSIDVHPTNSNIVFGSANATTWPGAGTLYGTGVYWSLDVFLTYAQAISATDTNQVIQVEYNQSDRLSWVLAQNEDRTYSLNVRVRHVF